MIYIIKKNYDEDSEIFAYLQHDNNTFLISDFVREYFKTDNPGMNIDRKEIKNFVEWLLDNKGFTQLSDNNFRSFAFFDRY